MDLKADIISCAGCEGITLLRRFGLSARPLHLDVGTMVGTIHSSGGAMRCVLVKSKRMPEDFILGVVFDVESTGALGFGSKRRDCAEIVKLYFTRVLVLT